MWMPRSWRSAQDHLRHRPILAELLPILALPVGPDFVRKMRREIQVSSSEIEHERRHHQSHLQGQQFVVAIEQGWNIEPANIRHTHFSQPFINLPFADVGSPRGVNFQRRNVEFRIAFDHENNTVDAEADPLEQPQSPPRHVSFHIGYDFFVHPCLRRSHRALRRYEDALAPRWRISSGWPAWPRFSALEDTSRPSASPGDPRCSCGRKRAPVAGPSAGRHLGGIAASRHRESGVSVPRKTASGRAIFVCEQNGKRYPRGCLTPLEKLSGRTTRRHA